MAEENNGMDIFNQDNIELNLNGEIDQDFLDVPTEDPEEEEKDPTLEGEAGNPEEPTQEEETEKEFSEDENPEEVAKEEDKDEEGESDPSDDDDSSNADDVSELYSSFASVLNEKGLLPSLDLENNNIKTIDDLTEHLKLEIDTQAKNYIIDKVGEDGYNALEKGVSLAEYQSYNTAIETLSNITDEVISQDIELAKNIIKQDYIAQGMSEDRANKILKKSIDLGEDIVLEDAKESLVSLKAQQSKKMEELQIQRTNERQNQIKQQEKIDNDLKNSIYNSKEIIEGFEPSKALKDKVYQSITKIVGQDPNGVAENKLMRQRRENPIEFDTKLYYLYEATNGFKDFSSLIRKSSSKALSNLEKEIRKTKFETSGKPSFVDDPESYGGLDDGSELII